MQTGSETLDLRQILGILRRRAPLIVLCVVVVAGAAFGFAKHKPRKYTATASLVFNQNPIGQEIAGLSGGAQATNSTELLAQVQSEIEVVKGGGTVAKTAAVLGHGVTEEQVAESVSIAGQGESGVVLVSASTNSPKLSAEIANSYTTEFVKEQQTANRQLYKSALALVRKQLAALSPQQRIGPDGLDLQNRAQTLSLLTELKEGNVQVAAEAVPPTSPSSPKTTKDAVIGIALGLVIGLGLAFALERLDRRVRQAEELELIYRLPLLGAVPKNTALSRPARDRKGRRTVPPPTVIEAFGLIRAHLRFFNVDRDLRTILIASATSGDGKTTIARHLAEATAALGSRVLLLEADMRKPTLAKQLDIQSGPGLADVLIAAVTMADATQRVELGAPLADGPRGRSLDVLVAGAVTAPNPAELLESQAMDAMLAHAKTAYDLVVIDTPPLSVVSDAFPLLTKVDGVVLVSWVGRSRREAAERLHQVLASSDSPLLGVIANGARWDGPGMYSDGGARRSPAVVASTNGAPSEELLQDIAQR